MATNPVRKWTVEEYLEFEESTEIKHEYISGDIVAMTGGTRKHSEIISNVNGSLWQATRGSTCRTHSSEMRVKIDDDNYFYPDASVVCGNAEFDNDNETTLINPTLIVEVTSPSSESFDKGIKANLYRSLESVQAYLVIDQHQIYAQLSTRQGDGWYLQEFTQRDQSISLKALNIDLLLDDIYLDIEFEK